MHIMACFHAQNEPIYRALMMRAENPIYTGTFTAAANLVASLQNSLYNDESPLAVFPVETVNFIQGFIDDTLTYINDIPAVLGMRSVMAILGR
jgi:hypothetical protein